MEQNKISTTNSYALANAQLEKLIAHCEECSFETIVNINLVLEKRRIADAYERIADALEQLISR